MNEIPMGGGLPLESPGVQPVGLGVQEQDMAMVPPEPIEPEPTIRGVVQDWEGGAPVNLKKVLKSGKTVGEELSAHLKETLDQELKNQEKVIERIKKANKLYKAEKRGGRPKKWMADVSIPIARKISDSIFVRIHDMIWNKQRVYLLRPKGPGTPELNDKCMLWEKSYNNYVKNDINLKEKMKFPTRQAVNSGTGVIKIVYEVNNKTKTDYATEEERLDPGVKKYKAPGGAILVKRPYIVCRGPNTYPIDRARFFISSDALTIDDAYMVGFSFDKRKSQLKVLAKNEIYDQDAVDLLSSDKPNEVTEERANSSGMELRKTKYTEPYTLHELWLRYDVDEDGEEDDICVTFHKESGQILKAIYNPIFYGYRPFVDFKGASQSEYTYDAEGICEIVEGICEEVDTLHNLMLDRLKLVNLPITFVRSGIGLDNYELEPGAVKSIDGDPINDIRELKMSDATFSLVNEINWLIQQADLVCGIVPGALGMSTAERPVAKAEMVNAEEYNKKFKSWTDNFRHGYKERAYRDLEAFAQYQPSYTFTDENGERITVDMPTGNIRDYLNIDLAVSSEEWNMTMRREAMLMKWQLLREHLTGNMALAQIIGNPQIPSDVKKYAVQINDVGSRILAQVLENFEDTEPQSTNVDMRQSMDVEKCVSASPDIMQLAMQQAMQAVEMAEQAAAQETGQPPGQQGAQPPGGQPQPPMGQ